MFKIWNKITWTDIDLTHTYNQLILHVLILISILWKIKKNNKKQSGVNKLVMKWNLFLIYRNDGILGCEKQNTQKCNT